MTRVGGEPQDSFDPCLHPVVLGMERARRSWLGLGSPRHRVTQDSGGAIARGPPQRDEAAIDGAAIDAKNEEIPQDSHSGRPNGPLCSP